MMANRYDYDWQDRTMLVMIQYGQHRNEDCSIGTRKPTRPSIEDTEYSLSYKLPFACSTRQPGGTMQPVRKYPSSSDFIPNSANHPSR